MPRTITGSYSTGVTLSVAGDNPVSVAAGAIVGNTAGPGLYSNTAVYWTITNAGAITGAGTTTGHDAGIGLAGAGAAITNQAGGIIRGYGFGVATNGVGTVVNQGTISASQTVGGGPSGSGYSFTAASGSIAASITALTAGAMEPGGAVSNAASAVITGVFQGVALNAPGTVENAGSIAGTGTSGIGVLLNGAGSVTNAIGGSIYGGQWGILSVGAAATLLNNGTVTGHANYGAFLFSGGSVTNGGSITGAQIGVAVGNGGSILNAADGQISSSGFGIDISGSVGTALNVGSVLGTKIGVLLAAGGLVTNLAPGRISSTYYGVDIKGGAGTVVNLGTISSAHFGKAGGILMPVGGGIDNAASATISATYIGAWIGSFTTAATGAGAVLNDGTITADDGAGHGAGVWIRAAAAYVRNDAGAVIHGGLEGVVFYQATTVINLGTISGASGAIGEGNPANVSPAGISLRLEQAPGAVISGGVVAPALGTGDSANVLELLSAASAGTISGFGSSYQNFGVVTLDAGAAWTLGGAVSTGQTIAFAGTASTGKLTLANPGSVAGVITGFGAGETIALAGITDVTGVSLSATGNVLSVYRSGGATPALTLNFDPTQSFSKPFTPSTNGTATDITRACFASGTRIRTVRGSVAVERLRVGLRVRTHRGSLEEIVWIGRRAVDCRRHPDPAAVQPVRIRAGAFGPGLPARDLRLSPDHAVFVDGVLIPVRCLVDGVAIVREDVALVVYYHIELRTHDVILAEGLPVESYLDTGNRANFAGTVVRLFPDFVAGMAAWEAAACAPLVVTGPLVDAARAALAARSASAGARCRA